MMPCELRSLRSGLQVFYATVFPEGLSTLKFMIYAFITCIYLS